MIRFLSPSFRVREELVYTLHFGSLLLAKRAPGHPSPTHLKVRTCSLTYFPPPNVCPHCLCFRTRTTKVDTLESSRHPGPPRTPPPRPSRTKGRAPPDLWGARGAADRGRRDPIPSRASASVRPSLATPGRRRRRDAPGFGGTGPP